MKVPNQPRNVEVLRFGQLMFAMLHDRMVLGLVYTYTNNFGGDTGRVPGRRA